MCNAIQGNILYILSEKTRRMLLRLTAPPTPHHHHPHPIIQNPAQIAAKIPCRRTCVVPGLPNLLSVQKDKMKPYNDL